MAGLSVTEKSFWKDRIAARIARRVEAIKARIRPCSIGSDAESYARRAGSLGLAGPYAELEAVQAEEAALARRKKRAQRTMLAALRGVPLDEVSDQVNVRYGGELPLPIEAAEALSKRQAAHQEQLLADDPIGHEIARLETEHDGLLDTIWLATSPAQIRSLWSKVSELLGDEPTRLEREALAIEPSKEA